MVAPAWDWIAIAVVAPGRLKPRSADSGIIRFGAIAVTRAMCAPGSLDGRVGRGLPYSRGYLKKDGKLYVTLLADDGVYEWAPLTAK